jgi:hypothetical protein
MGAGRRGRLPAPRPDPAREPRPGPSTGPLRYHSRPEIGYLEHALRPSYLLRLALSPLVVATAHVAPARAQDTPPPGMAAVEAARSRDCVAEMAKIADLNAVATPYVNRAQRIQALAKAVALEDTTEVAPMDTLDAVEREVHAWFRADSDLAHRILAGDSTLVAARDQARDGIKQRLQEAMDGVSSEAQSKLKDAGQVQSAAQPCEAAIFVRPAVLEACKTQKSPLCEAARAKPDSLGQRSSQFRFVEAPQDLWDVEELRPWTTPGPIQVGPDGSLVGARTSARVRHGNIVVAVSLAPMIRDRAQLDSTQIARYQANLDTLGFTFQHPRFVMAPTLDVQASVPAPMDGENTYLLHFGDLEKPEVVWSAKVDSGGVIRASIPATGALLEKLKAGAPLSFTAVKLREGSTEGTPVYSVSLLNLNEAQASIQLLGYMAGGDLGRDLAKIIPPGGETAHPGR